MPTVWTVVSLLVVLLAPAQLIQRVPFLADASPSVPQTLLMGTVFLLLVIVLTRNAHRQGGPRLVTAFLVAAICYGATAWILDRFGRELVESATALVLSAVLGTALVVFPFFGIASLRKLTTAVLAMGLGAVLVLQVRANIAADQRTLRPTGQTLLSITTSRDLLGPRTNQRAGAIEPYGKSFLLMTGDGDFYTLDWGANDSLIANRLPLSLPIDASAVKPDQKMVGPRAIIDHRVIDMKVDTASTPHRVFVAHEEWNYAKKCYSVIVSVASLSGAREGAPLDAWKTIYETRPCVETFVDYLEAGGRLGWLGDKLLLTTGDFGTAGSIDPAHAQDDTSDWGKILLLDQSGNREVFSKGHRNPQGLFVDKEQQVWSTEHGPKGGDEINLVQKGGNYGWPLATYGTNYGRYAWHLAPRSHNHGEFDEPVYAFVPSVGVSNVIQVEADLFPEWKGDLLVASLVKETLFRVRLNKANAITFVEPIFIGFRIRDLAEGADGRIVLWTDEGALVALSPGPAGAPDGELIFFGNCGQCHDRKTVSVPFAPSLRSIVGADVAADRTFQYSAALRQLGGKWTEDRLDAFLSDPGRFAPGSNMSVGQLPDAKERRAVIEFLKTYR